jgi:hypothetical protein
MSDQQKQGQGSQHQQEDWKKNPSHQGGQQGGGQQGGQWQGGQQGGQKNPQSDRDRMEKDKEKRSA